LQSGLAMPYTVTKKNSRKEEFSSLAGDQGYQNEGSAEKYVICEDGWRLKLYFHPKKDKVLVERIVSGVCIYERKQGHQLFLLRTFSNSMNGYWKKKHCMEKLNNFCEFKKKSILVMSAVVKSSETEKKVF